MPGCGDSCAHDGVCMHSPCERDHPAATHVLHETLRGASPGCACISVKPPDAWLATSLSTHIYADRQFTGAVHRGAALLLTGLSTRSGDQSCTLLKSKAAALQPGAACLTRSLAQFCSSLK